MRNVDRVERATEQAEALHRRHRVILRMTFVFPARNTCAARRTLRW
jgi:hypothetical protein